MADRRPEDLSPPTVPFRPVPGQPPAGSSGSSPFEGRMLEEHRPIHERINAAYASSAPIVPDEPEEQEPTGEGDGGAGTPEPTRPSGAERFAAILAATTAAGRGRTQAPEAPIQEEAPAAATAASSGAGPGASPAPPAEPAHPSKQGRKSAAPAARRVRKARLRLTHVDPWSVMKTSFLLAVALGIVLVVAVAVVWTVLGAAGVWSAIDSAVGDVLGDTGSSFRVEDYLGMGRVMGFTMVVAVFDVVLITVIATLGAFLYNLAATLLGGIEVVMAEDDR